MKHLSNQTGENSALKILGFYLGVLFLFTLIFILSFHSPLFSQQKVLFYRGVALLIATTIIASGILIFLNKRVLKLHLETLIAALTISVSLNLSFFIVFPVTFDRSVTTYLLSAINEKSHPQTCGGLTEKQLEQFFIEEYVLSQKAVNRRIREQLIIKTVKKDKDCLKLTQRGYNLLNFSNFIKKIYLLSRQKY
ncbi:MAG: hypothetical protein ACPLY7_02050 [Microgenomates group bacterium]